MLASLNFLCFDEPMTLDLMTLIFKMDKNLGRRQEVHSHNKRNCSQMNRSSNTGGKWVLSYGVPLYFTLPTNKMVEERALKN